MPGELILKKGNTFPFLESTLESSTGSGGPVDLTTAKKVKVLLRGVKTKTALEGICEVPEPKSGVVVYKWLASDTAVVDEYEVEYEVEWNDETIESFPNEGVKKIEIQPVI